MFKLNIECTRDIEELHINFADGTSVVKEVRGAQKSKNTDSKPKENITDEHSENQGAQRGGFLDINADFSTVSKEVIELPTIDEKSGTPNVAPEMQNLNF